MDGVDDDTWAKLLRALGENDAEGIEHTIRTCSEFLGLSYQEGAERLLDGHRNASGTALEALSDDVPAEVAELVSRASRETAQPMTAVKRSDGAYPWVLYTRGNPIQIEGWFRRAGHRALAADAARCFFDPSADRRIINA